MIFQTLKSVLLKKLNNIIDYLTNTYNPNAKALTVFDEFANEIIKESKNV